MRLLVGFFDVLIALEFIVLDLKYLKGVFR